jgi:hypothetical protein
MTTLVDVADERHVILDVMGVEREDQPQTGSEIDQMLWQQASSLTDVRIQEISHDVAARVAANNGGVGYSAAYERVCNFLRGRAFSPEGHPPVSVPCQRR